jgi:hypothetical protein
MTHVNKSTSSIYWGLIIDNNTTFNQYIIIQVHSLSFNFLSFQCINFFLL